MLIFCCTSFYSLIIHIYVVINLICMEKGYVSTVCDLHSYLLYLF